MDPTEAVTRQFVSGAGKVWTVRVVASGDQYGRSGSATTGGALVEFYDATYTGSAFGPLGQFVSRYYVDTLLEPSHGGSGTRRDDAGLCLNMDVPEWSIDATTMAQIRAWLTSPESARRKVTPRPSGPKDAIWQVDPHTLAKHEILRRYLDAWFPIMSKWNPRLIFFDGFAGPGIYQNKEPGSPLIALRRLIEHSAYAQFSIGTEYIFLFCEPDPDRLASLEQHLEDYKQRLGGQWPASVKVAIRGQPFDATAGAILEDLERAGSRLAPTFAFVDPFGISGLPMNLLSRLTASPKCELFVNMIMNAAKRFATSGLIDASLADLYGTNQFTQAEGLTGRPRIEFLHDLYAQQLKSQCRFPYIQSFEMVNKGGHTSYYLFYATRDLAGLRSMKAAMWKADPGGGYRFSDRLAGQDVLLIEDALNPTPLLHELLRVFRGRTVPVEELEQHVLVKTVYRETHLRNPVLTTLEKEGVISVTRPGRRQYPKGTLITFP